MTEAISLPQYFFLSRSGEKTILWYDGEEYDEMVAVYTGEPSQEQVLNDAEEYLGR